MGRQAKRYLRFGQIGTRKSRIGDSYRTMIQVRTGVTLPEYEAGLSVFDTYWSDILKQWVLPETHGTAASAGELYAEAVDSHLPILLVTGRRVRGPRGEGSDGEPLLIPNSVQIVESLTTSQVWEEAAGLDLDFEEGMTEGERRLRYRELREKLRAEAKQKR